jgi:hypothetical protein
MACATCCTTHLKALHVAMTKVEEHMLGKAGMAGRKQRLPCALQSRSGW